MPVRYPLPQQPPLQRRPKSRVFGTLTANIDVSITGPTALLVFAAPTGAVTVAGGLPEIVLRPRVAC